MTGSRCETQNRGWPLGMCFWPVEVHRMVSCQNIRLLVTSAYKIDDAHVKAVGNVDGSPWREASEDRCLCSTSSEPFCEDRAQSVPSRARTVALTYYQQLLHETLLGPTIGRFEPVQEVGPGCTLPCSSCAAWLTNWLEPPLLS